MLCFGNDEIISYFEIFEKEKDVEECKNKKEKEYKNSREYTNSLIRCEIKNVYFLKGEIILENDNKK